jgi:hypothetical protein
MDTIWSCGFGLDTDMQNNVNDPYLIHSQEIFVDKFRLDVIIALFLVELSNIFVAIHYYAGVIRYWLRNHIAITKKFIDENPMTWIIKEAKTIIDKRQQVGQTNRTDLLQLMLESASDDDYIHVCRFNFC